MGPRGTSGLGEHFTRLVFISEHASSRCNSQPAGHACFTVAVSWHHVALKFSALCPKRRHTTRGSSSVTLASGPSLRDLCLRQLDDANWIRTRDFSTLSTQRTWKCALERHDIPPTSAV